MPIAVLEQRRAYYYAATAYTKDGWESYFSNEVSYSAKDSVSLTEVISSTLMIREAHLPGDGMFPVVRFVSVP